jgi:hypothetical protein
MAHVFKWGEGERVEMSRVEEPRGWRIQMDPVNTGAIHFSMGTQDIPPRRADTGSPPRAGGGDTLFP